MKLSELKHHLSKHPAAKVKFILPNGEAMPLHAHVTEVARIDKKFVDCGGTFREESYCRLQTWVANDTEHRLTAKKLLGILNTAQPVLQGDELETDVEYQLGHISQFPLQLISGNADEILLYLTVRNTACLAPEKCCPQTPNLFSIGK